MLGPATNVAAVRQSLFAWPLGLNAFMAMAANRAEKRAAVGCGRSNGHYGNAADEGREIGNGASPTDAEHTLMRGVWVGETCVWRDPWSA